MVRRIVAIRLSLLCAAGRSILGDNKSVVRSRRAVSSSSINSSLPYFPVPPFPGTPRNRLSLPRYLPSLLHSLDCARKLSLIKTRAGFPFFLPLLASSAKISFPRPTMLAQGQYSNGHRQCPDAYGPLERAMAEPRGQLRQAADPHNPTRNLIAALALTSKP